MSYSAQELSVEGAQPIELYDFRYGTEAYSFTTNPVAVTYNSVTYVPMEIVRESVAFSPESRAEVLKITMPASVALVRKYINSVPGMVATLTLRRVHRNDGAGQLVEMLKGTVRTVSFTFDGLKAEVAVMPITGSLSGDIPRFVYSGTCNNVLYDQGCTVASSLFRYIGLVSAVNNDQITVNGLTVKGSNWAAAGFVINALGDYRLVLAHTGDVLRLFKPFPTSPLGSSVEVYAGCDHSAMTCDSKFTNITNFGGYPFVPTKNIFSTGLD